MQKNKPNSEFEPDLSNTELSNLELDQKLNLEFEKIFKNASKTYFYSSLFFPKKIRQEINILYAFVRTADDFVDSIPSNSTAFFAFKNYYLQNSKIIPKNNLQTISNLNSKPNLNYQNKNKTQNLENYSKNEININEIEKVKKLEFWQKIVLAFVDLEERLEFEKSWTLAFLQAMENDLSVQTYSTIEQTCEYIYGSANVIGFFMAKILKLPSESYKYAGFLGQSFQYINFIRDIAEDLELKRSYFPQKLLQECNLQSLKLAETSQKPEEFQKFIKICLGQYEVWQTEAEKGFKFFPKKYKIAIKTASDMYKWTAKIIANDPFIVYQKKIKPQKRRVLLTGLINYLNLD